MILVDTSVWIDHWRSPLFHLIALLQDEGMLMRPMIIGELACGNIEPRQETVRILARLPQEPIAGLSEIPQFIEQRQVMGRGIGYVDVRLLAPVPLEGSAKVWAVDRRLHRVADELALAYHSADTGTVC